MATKRQLGGVVALATALTLPIAVQASASAQTSVTKGTAADLRVLTPLNGEVIGAGSFKLDFSFKSRSASPITAVELYVDGVRWANRTLDVPSLGNVLTFDVDGSTLTEGSHVFQVKVLARSGAWSSTEVQVVAQSKGGQSANVDTAPTSVALGAPAMTFRALPAKRLSGAVEILLDVKSPNGQNPYVSFYVDRQFKTLKNYPPYSFIFDTTTVGNGLHTIEATGYLEASNTSTTQRLQVMVDNAGGNTDRATEIKDLNNGPTTPPQVSATRGALAANVRTSAGLREITTGTPGFGAARTAAPKVAGRTTRPITKTVSAPRGLMPKALDLQATTGFVPAVALGRPIPSAPNSAPVSISRPAAPKVRTNTNVAATLTKSMLEPKLLQVAFNGTAIRFDVEPRVEAGIPLAPFRQIFEHTGGQVMWMPDSKTVRALNADREVVIHVGAPNASVNGTTVPMERTSFIDRGRTIVPLSFVGKALDVQIDFDPATGRLSITSKN